MNYSILHLNLKFVYLLVLKEHKLQSLRIKNQSFKITKTKITIHLNYRLFYKKIKINKKKV